MSLRLALASSYARRGAPLPLVLDDVLVNFDADRAKAAAAVLRDFAAAGHQLLVFTCHEHILEAVQVVEGARQPAARQQRAGARSWCRRSLAARRSRNARNRPGPRAARADNRKEEIVEDEPPDDATQVEDGLDEADGEEDDEDASLWNEDEGDDSGHFDDDAAAA